MVEIKFKFNHDPPLKDCDICEECLETPNHHFKTCVKTGTKCRKDDNCKENQKCLTSLSIDVGGKRCYAAPFNCRSDEDCSSDGGNHCVISRDFADYQGLNSI